MHNVVKAAVERLGEHGRFGQIAVDLLDARIRMCHQVDHAHMRARVPQRRDRVTSDEARPPRHEHSATGHRRRP